MTLPEVRALAAKFSPACLKSTYYAGLFDLGPMPEDSDGNADIPDILKQERDAAFKM